MSLIRRRIKGWAYALSLVFLAGAVWLPSVIAQPIPQPGSGTSNPALNTSQTPDTYYLSTDPLGNSLIIGEAADSGFDFAHAQATDPTLFIQSHNQATNQWISLKHDGTNAIVDAGTGNVFLRRAGSTVAGTSSVGWDIGSNLLVGGNGIGAGDAFLAREAAAIWQLGQDVNGAAVAQTFKAHDGITGTDIKGASLTLAGGLGTGKAASNPLTLNRVIGTTTGTTAQTYAPGYVVCPAVRLSTTSATAQTIATITTTSTTGGGVTMDYTSVACSGTTCDTDGGMVKVAWNNNAGTVAAAMTAVALQSDSDATGTLATTPTATVATNVVSVKFTPTWVTIVPTSVLGFATFTVASSADTVTCVQQ